MRVMVAMSGGVDSSVAAGLMLEAGHEVVGVTLKLRDVAPMEVSGRSASCCSPDDLMDARAVCDHLGVAHYVVDDRARFDAQVVQPFARAYLEGRTPNPCVLCNDHIKFAPLLDRARALGCERLVTGHYARLEHGPDQQVTLRAGLDAAKDQSYFLFGVPKDVLRHVWFPLGGMDKPQVRAHAVRLGLPVAAKRDSEDICFVPDGDYARTVEQIVGASAVPPAGVIRDQSGAVVGQHDGVHRYTVGQRRGLRVPGVERLYVLSVDGPSHEIVVGPKQALLSAGLVARDWKWISAPAGEVTGRVRIRYRHPGSEARARVLGDGQVEIRFSSPQAAVAPGQAAVLYRGDTVLGGGWIERPIPQGEAPVG
jgi:tRNA-uridine 2-sulfurtransferase